MAINWTKKSGDVWSGRAGPLVLTIQPKGDGRWTWQVFDEGNPNPMASGVATSLGGAKNVVDQFVKRTR